ncbi:transcription elongation factor TFIIS-like [Nicotiana tabacum]|uniref:Transcription elongation factor TFIIS-like n=1 Tax=Nicotiana tabacum TaxID=4097 RepID=A0AC58S6Z0_TOBAC
MFEKWGRSNGAQKFKYRSIMFNIKDPNNPDFRRKVLIGQIPPRSITELTPEEMASEERQKQNEKIKEKALFNSERGLPAQASTDKFKCDSSDSRRNFIFRFCPAVSGIYRVCKSVRNVVGFSP